MYGASEKAGMLPSTTPRHRRSTSSLPDSLPSTPASVVPPQYKRLVEEAYAKKAPEHCILQNARKPQEDTYLRACLSTSGENGPTSI